MCMFLNLYKWEQIHAYRYIIVWGPSSHNLCRLIHHSPILYSLNYAIYGGNIVCLIGIILATNEDHEKRPFLLKKKGLPCDALCIVFSDPCFVHVQGSMNSCTCYKKVWICIVFSSILTSIRPTMPRKFRGTPPAVEPNVSKVVTSKSNINRFSSGWLLLNSQLFWQLIPRNLCCVFPTVDGWNPAPPGMVLKHYK